MHESYIKWIEAGQPKIFCGCGCGQEIIIKQYHSRRGMPKYYRGHFIRSDEQNSEMSKLLSGENNPFYGKHHTEEQCNKWRETRKGKLTGDKNPAKRPEVRKKIKQSKKIIVDSAKIKYENWIFENINKNLCQCGCNNFINIKKSHYYKFIPKYIRGHYSIGRKAPWASGNKNVSHRPEVRKIKSEKLSGKNNPNYGKPPSHTKKCYYNSPLQGEVCFRSSWELAYANYLDDNKILWMYEIETFDLGNMTYTPDFFLPQFEKFVEIKGFMRSEAQEKINKFLEQYPWDLEILFKDDLIKLGVIING